MTCKLGLMVIPKQEFQKYLGQLIGESGMSPLKHNTPLDC